MACTFVNCSQLIKSKYQVITIIIIIKLIQIQLARFELLFEPEEIVNKNLGTGNK